MVHCQEAYMIFTPGTVSEVKKSNTQYPINILRFTSSQQFDCSYIIMQKVVKMKVEICTLI